MQDTVYITKEGLEKLKEELKELKEVKVTEVAKKIQDARDLGDISENVAYDDAKNEQAVIEGRIKELEEIIKASKIADSNGNEVSVGSKVLVHVEGNEMELHIVGPTEADPTSGKISHASPIGQSLMGKVIGDEVEVEAPIGKLKYRIVKIK